jgi:hypothetical protein
VGTAYGYHLTAKASVDFAVYYEGSDYNASQYSVYIVALGSFPVWDLSIKAPQLGVVLYEPSLTVVTSPTGTLITGSALSVLTTIMEMSSRTATTSYNSFNYSWSSNSPYWSLAGSSNLGMVNCGAANILAPSQCQDSILEHSYQPLTPPPMV